MESSRGGVLVDSTTKESHLQPRAGEKVFFLMKTPETSEILFLAIRLRKKDFQTFGDGTLWQAISTVIKSSEFFRMTFFSP